MQMRIRSMGVALRFAESVLLSGGQRQARRNAWAAVCENRRYAADRRHDALVSGAPPGPPSGPATGPATGRPARRRPLP
ncbi:hypothetical protein ABZW10_08885 [Kitasatospora sp. NPDC004723]|uniref:hypothetical protein n=1 Tax=Kitasatospora sp. NPDC004723 TaxID=3154288 RepID=UPI0033A46AA8